MVSLLVPTIHPPGSVPGPGRRDFPAKSCWTRGVGDFDWHSAGPVATVIAAGRCAR